jgi:hypothetical protein
MDGMMLAGQGSGKGAGDHAKLFLQSTVGANPVAASVAIGALVVAVVVLAYFVVKYKPTTSTKSGFVTSMNNLTHGGARPLWHLGNGDAGNGGSMHRAPTAAHNAVTNPGAAPRPAPLCGGWSPEAGEEAHALAAVGGFQHDSYGEASLQRAVAGSVSDATLSKVMHQGGAHP